MVEAVVACVARVTPLQVVVVAEVVDVAVEVAHTLVPSWALSC